VKDQHSTSDHDEEEPVRFRVPPQPSNNPPGIPPEFVYDPEYDAYFAPGEPSTFDAEAFRRDLNKHIEEAKCEDLITDEELRVAGAFDFPPRRPPRRRKSLRNEPDLFSNLIDDAGPRPNEACPEKVDTDDKAPSDEGAGPQTDRA
jgi:hypothetical protein